MSLAQSIALLEGGPDEKFDPNEGRWVTIRGKRIFIPNAVQMRPVPAPREGTDSKRVKGKDGKLGPRILTDKYNDRKSKFKYARAFNMAKSSDRIRKQLSGEASRKKIDEKKATGTACLLMHLTGMRVGGNSGQSYAKQGSEDFGVKGPSRDDEGNPVKGDLIATYGATTVEKRHVKLNGDVVQLNYYGKSGVIRNVRVEDKVLADSLRDFMGGDSESESDEPLFGGLTSSAKTIKRTKKFNMHYKNHDYRTVVAMGEASTAVASVLANPPRLESFFSDADKGKPKTPARVLRAQTSMAKYAIAKVSQRVADRLGNEPGAAQKSYVNPEVYEYMLGEMGLSHTLDKKKKVGPFNKERSAILPSKFLESKGWSAPDSHRDLDTMAIGVNAIQEKTGTLSARMPILAKLFGEDVVRALVGEFLSDSDIPGGGMTKILAKE